MCATLDLEDLQYSDEYAEFIMENGKGDRLIHNGNSLTEAMEEGYLWEDFLISIGVKE
jgi:hypothetical protein